MTDQQIIDVVTAHRDGRKIQSRFRRAEECPWYEADKPVWDFNTYDYRVKPEPREAWMVVCNHEPTGTAFSNKDAAVRHLSQLGHAFSVVHFREVTDG